jgi:hypothetical protein
MKTSEPPHIALWKDAFAKIFGKYSLKRFKGKIGISPETIHEVWEHSNLKNSPFVPKDLLIFYLQMDGLVYSVDNAA